MLMGSVESRTTADGQQRTLVVTADIQLGELIFQDLTRLHTLHPRCRQFQPREAIPLAYDWQRLIDLWARLSMDQPELITPFKDLSTDGVTSKLAQQVDPDRLRDYRKCAVDIRAATVNAVRRRKPKPIVPSADEFERFLHVIETNCHSRSLDDLEIEIGTKFDENILDAYGNEEFVGIWPVASMMQHACRPNAAADITLGRTGETAHIWVRALRDIKAGDEITISYHDEEFLPRALRQELLNRRGFKCRCEWCALDVDVTRRYQCVNTDDCRGWVYRRGTDQWVCTKCGRLESSPLPPEELRELELLGDCMDDDDNRLITDVIWPAYIDAVPELGDDAKLNDMIDAILNAHIPLPRGRHHTHWAFFCEWKELVTRYELGEENWMATSADPPSLVQMAVCALIHSYHEFSCSLTGQSPEKYMYRPLADELQVLRQYLKDEEDDESSEFSSDDDGSDGERLCRGLERTGLLDSQ